MESCLKTDGLKSLWAAEKKRILTVLLAAFAWGLLAHGYAFANPTFSHDSLNEMFLSGSMHYAPSDVAEWKISLGRFGNVLYRFVFQGDVSSPWLGGMLALVWLALAAYITVHVLSVRRLPALILTAGVMTVNVTVIAQTATYINDLDANMFGVMAAVLAVLLWKKDTWVSLLLGAVCAAAALSIYQSNISVSVALIIFVCVQELLRGKSFREVFGKGLKSLAMLAAGALLYLLGVQLSCLGCQTELSSGYNGLSNLWTEGGHSLPWYAVRSYFDWAHSFLQPKSAGSGSVLLCCNALLAVLTAAALVRRLLRQETKGWKEIVLLLVLGLLLPLGMNVSFVLNKGSIHDLMCYATWLIYLLALVMPEGEGKWLSVSRIAAYALVFVILCGNVQTANAAYLKKDLERQESLSLMTGVAERMEQTEGYEPGVTEVAFVGVPELNTPAGFEELERIVGLGFRATVTYTDTCYAYMEYILQRACLRCPDPESMGQDERVAVMPCFPAADSVRMVDGVLVVKLGEPPAEE